MNDDATFEHVDVLRDGRVATVTLNRPEVKNAIDKRLHVELNEALLAADADPDTEVIVLTGAGDVFCGGGDLRWVLSMNGDPRSSAEGMRMGREIQHTMLDLAKPIIAKVRGSAIGLGCTLALYCDMVFATPESTFVDPHVNVGLVAGDGGAVVWPQLVGFARAKRYLLTGDPITGEDAARIGLITEAVSDENLDRVVADMAERLAGGPTLAIRWTKASINAGLKLTASTVVEVSALYENLSLLTADNRAACEAFLSRERPKFTGR